MKRQMEKDIRTFHRVVGQLDDDIHNSSNRITRSIDIPLTLKHTVKISEVHNCYKLNAAFAMLPTIMMGFQGRLQC